ncbi:MAG: DUF1116 domain-containing protein [Oscillospiraceae bacterium]|nr:DUF1116 domain-containing protein [Oscillospiraceae bacterium]
MEIKDKIETANQKAAEIFTEGRPIWTDVCLAGDVIPGMTKNTILIAGPPIDIDEIPEAVRTAVCGALRYEGRASTNEEAWELVKAGEIAIEPAQDHDTACGAAMALSAHMHVIVCEDKVYGGKGFCAPHPGNSPVVLRWGRYNEQVQAQLEWFRDCYCPGLSQVIRKIGGIDLISILSRTAGMGDENHNRQTAASLLMATQLIHALIDMDIPEKEAIIKELAVNDRFFLHVMMAGAESVISSVKGIPFSTVMTGMGGNGVKIGLQFAGTGKKWFTTEAPYIQGLFLKPSYTLDDMVRYLGDSCVTEVYGLGGMSAIAGPGYVIQSGFTFEEAKRRTEDARAVSIAEHRFAPIPWDEGRGFPVGIDMRKVVALNILPTSHGGGTLKAGGQGTMGCAKLPMECFRQGLREFAELVRKEE